MLIELNGLQVCLCICLFFLFVCLPSHFTESSNNKKRAPVRGQVIFKSNSETVITTFSVSVTENSLITLIP